MHRPNSTKARAAVSATQLHVGMLGWLAVPLLAIMLLLAGCASDDMEVGGVAVGPAAIQGLSPSGQVGMTQVQAAYIGSGSAGSGTLWFRGRAYPFSVGGLGVGGIGFSTIEAYGEVYKLEDVYQFPGAYAQGRYGFALGEASKGDLWLQNEAGVILQLKAKRTGLMLSLGGDAVVIDMNK